MKMKLKGLLLVGMLAALPMMKFPDQVMAQNAAANHSGMHPRVLNRLLAQASEFWGMSLGQTYQAHNQGRVSVQLITTNESKSWYELMIDNDCAVIIAIENTW